MEKWKLKPSKDHGLTPKERYKSVARESGLIESILRYGWWGFLRFYMVIFHRLKIHGREHLPIDSSYILAANHESHLDALVVGSALPLQLRDKIFPIAAGDVFFTTYSISAFAALAMNALPIWRRNFGRHELDELRARLIEEHSLYILFPEGTRTRTGEMARFRKGIGMFVAGTPVPIVPCYIEGAFEAFPPKRVLPRLKKISLFIGEPMVFESVSNDSEGWKQIAADVEARVQCLASELEVGDGGGVRKV